MLERIVNIAPGSDYQKSSAKSSQYTRSANFLHSLNATMNDSISLSPATAYLSIIGWKLKKLNNPKEKIIVAFEFDEFEFTATLSNPGNTKTISYEVKKTINKIPYVYQAVIGIDSGNLKKHNEKFDVVVHLPILNLFFDELARLSEYSANISVDNVHAKDAFFDMEKNLKHEFEYVNGCVISFLEKYLSMKLHISDQSDGIDKNLLLTMIQITRF